MKHWVFGIVLAAVALGLLYGSAVASQQAATASWVMLLGVVLAVLGIFGLIASGTKHAAVAGHAAPAAQPAVENDAWRGTGETLLVSLVGLVGLLVYVGIYVGGWAGVAGFIVYFGVAMSFVMLTVVVMLTAGKTE